MPKNDFSELSQSMATAVEKAAISVVSVSARKRFPASGFALSPDSIITASHVIEREEDIQVGMNEDKELHATLVGRDIGSDLAVIKLNSPRLKPIEKVAYEPRIGELAIALGRPGSQRIQASLGIIHAVGGPIRTQRGISLDRYLLTDATPYPGFSGGPLINTEGLVIGLNTSGFAPGSSIVIPANLVWQIFESINQYGKVRRGYLGIHSQVVQLPETAAEKLGRSQETGLLLIGIEEKSPASMAGLMVGDILISINQHLITNHDDLMLALGANNVGQKIQVEILRGGTPQALEVTIGERD